MRQIDADALKEVFIQTLENIKSNPRMTGQEMHIITAIHTVGQMIDDAPTIDAEPVKHGHWVYEDGKMGFGIGAWCCSECGEENESLPFHKCKDPYAYAASKYCACCGARMYE